MSSVGWVLRFVALLTYCSLLFVVITLVYCCLVGLGLLFAVDFRWLIWVWLCYGLGLGLILCLRVLFS